MAFRVGDCDYTSVIGSDLDRDGMYLEVTEDRAGSPVILEIFYSDRSGEMTLSTFRSGVPVKLVDWALRLAKDRLPPMRNPHP